MSARQDALQDALRDASANDEPPEVLHEIISALARAHGAEVGASHPHVLQMRRSAASLRLIFGRHGADESWTIHGRNAPWWDRPFIQRRPTEQFRRDWSAELRQYGRQIAEAAA